MLNVLQKFFAGLGMVLEWWRELAGWLLLFVGLGLFYVCYEYIRVQRVIEAGPLSIIGIVVFRGGIHLLKVAVAVRICREARNRAKADAVAPVARPIRPAARVNSLAARGS